MAAKLKVFSWSDGFHAFTVAVSSKPKALEAWGIGQDIFKSGLAREVSGGPACDAALKTPGRVIQTGEAVDIGAIQAAPTARRQTGSTPVQKQRIRALEQALAEMDTAHAEALVAADEALKAVQKRRTAIEADQFKERQALAAKLKAARTKT
ncbi:MAG: hypothetical protein JWR59_2196 [Brevundimonas sp.]|nr:hypothetical protein [Brevundimonas sp.]